MPRAKLSDRDFAKLAKEFGVTEYTAKAAVQSYFSVMRKYAQRLPLNNASRIYDKDKFSEFERVWNIPYIGRIGLSYSRYLKWRANASKDISQKPRSHYKSRIMQEDIEEAAQAILDGKPMPKLHKKKIKELYDRVWLVGQEHKRLARQVIPKTDKNVQDT